MLSTALLITAIILLMLVNAAGVVLTALQLPGNWLILAASATFAWYRWDEPAFSLGWHALVALLALALLGELLEFVAGALGSRTAGGSKRGAAISILTAIAGAILGSFLIPIPIVGTLLGAAVGASLGSLLGDKWAGRTWTQTVRSAKGAFLGKLTGTALKLVIAVALFVTVVIALLL